MRSNRRFQITGACVAVGALAVASPAASSASAPAADGIIAIVHMTNTKDAVKYAMDQGANAVELDLRFTDAGEPDEFRHGGAFCDCTCYCATSDCEWDTVCGPIDDAPGSMCGANTDADDMAAYLAAWPDQLAVIYVDSKVTDSDLDLTAAGTSVIAMLDNHTFSGGFRGQVIISAPEAAQAAYIKAAIAAAASSANSDRYFFTIDDEGDDFGTAMSPLMDTPRRGFSTGVSACSPGTYYEAIERAARNQSNGVLAFTGIWTLDQQDSMETYLDKGATALMSNNPGNMLAAIAAKGLTLAEPGSALSPTTSNTLAQ